MIIFWLLSYEFQMSLPNVKIQSPYFGYQRIRRDVIGSSFSSAEPTSSISHYVEWQGILNNTDNRVINPKEMTFQGQTMASITHNSGGGETINKRSDTLTKWALSHPKCATNVTSYVGQTARMHCCLARLDRDLSVNFFFFFIIIFQCYQVP